MLQILKMDEICLDNVIFEYHKKFYSQKNGIVTGDSHSVLLANISVHYVICGAVEAIKHAEIF